MATKSKPDNPEPIGLLKDLSEHFKHVRLGPGVVGKTVLPMLALIGVWGIALWQMSDNWTRNIFVFGGACIATLAFNNWFTRSQSFAERNPSLALLEGAELLEYQRFEAQAKGLPPADSQVLLQDPRRTFPSGDGSTDDGKK